MRNMFDHCFESSLRQYFDTVYHCTFCIQIVALFHFERQRDRDFHFNLFVYEAWINEASDIPESLALWNERTSNLEV